jgi:hypothetical protein
VARWRRTTAQRYPDRSHSGSPDPRPRLRNWTMNRALNAAQNDILLTERFFRVTNLVDPPTRLQDPSLMVGAVGADDRRRSRVWNGCEAPSRA